MMAIAMAMAMSATPVLHFLLQMLLNARLTKPIRGTFLRRVIGHVAIY
jgi:hypothetical protein